MKASLNFNLDDFEDKMAHYRCVKSLDMSLFIFEVLNIKRDDINSLDEVWQKIDDAVIEYGINTDDLII